MVEHEVKLFGAALNGTVSPAPLLLARKDPDFLKTMLREVRTASGRQDLLKTKVNEGTAASPALLYQPVQRVMHMALMEAFCAVPGNPRLDSTKIDSAGVVIRRVPVKPNPKTGILEPDFQTTVREAWMQSPQGGVGWIKLNAVQQKLDPDPKRRKLLHTGQSYLDQVLQDKLQGPSASEAVSPAFPAPPDVCADATKTLIFALLPLSSSELSGPPTQLVDDSALKQHIPVFLKKGNKMAPLAGKTITSDYVSEGFLRASPLSTTDQSQFKTFLTLLTMMAIEFGIFEPDATNESKTLLTRLNGFSVTFQDQNKKTTRHQPLGDFLHHAKAVLLDHDPKNPSSSLVMPTAWPDVGDHENGIFTDVKNAVQKSVSVTRQNTGRFQNPERVYQLRAFIRVKHDENCPPEIVWSDPSSYFKIAAWYDGPGVPTPPVVLPDLSDRNALKKLKPNVSFGVPASLANAMQGASLDDLMKGKAGGGSGNLDWICGFNIPIITICAFFVLNIFLSLLNIVFFWLPFVKICIPIPKGTLNSE
jgi:hypothetical protein